LEAGDEGNLPVWPEGKVWLPLIPVEAVDATGAGEAFAGALAVVLPRTTPWRKPVRSPARPRRSLRRSWVPRQAWPAAMPC